MTACLLTMAVNWLALRRWRRSVSAHWTERARLLWPARISGKLNIVYIPMCLLLAHQLLQGGSMTRWVPLGLAAWAGSVLGTYPFDRELYPSWPLSSWLHGVAGHWVLRFGVLFIIIGGSAMMPDQFGWRAVLIAAIVLGLHLCLQWGFGLKLLRLTRLVTSSGERLQRIVADASSRMNVRVRGVWLLASPAAQAFALPTTGELLFSDPLLQLCADEEVSAICAHELGHLTESRSVLAGRILGSLAWYPVIFMRPVTNQLGHFGIVVLLTPVLLIAFFARWLSRRMEKRADQVATDNQAEAGVYARALEKLYRANHLPAVNPNNRMTHPHLYDRLVAAGVTPDYPRPGPPGKYAWTGWVVMVAFGILVGILVVREFQPDVGPANPEAKNATAPNVAAT